MRVVYVTNDFLDETGGTARHVDELSARMTAHADVAVVYLSLRGRREAFLDHAGRQVVCLPCTGSLSRRWWSFPRTAVAETLAWLQPDLVHVHTPLEAALVEPPDGRAVFYTLHSSVYARLAQKWLYREQLLPRLWQKFDAIIAPSRTVADLVRHERVAVIPNGVDLARVALPRPSTELRQHTWQERFGLDAHGRTMLLIASRLEPVKGVLPLVERNAELLHARRSDLSLVIAGDGSEREALAALIAEKQLTNVHLLGALPHDEVCELYRISDLCIVPSQYETFGLTAIEAMAAGTPVATTAKGALRELVTPGYTGFQLGENLSLEPVLIAETQGAWSRVAANALRLVANFDWQSVALQTLALYRQFVRWTPQTSPSPPLCHSGAR